MTAQTFIFVHDQQIVLDYLAAGKFHDLPDVKYVFLGQRNTDRIESLSNVIIARNLPDNIEHFPNLVAWTGWYALVRNRLITADLVNLFEYDVNVIGKWEQPSEPCGYLSMPSTNEMWWNWNGIKDEVSKFAEGFNSNTPVPMTSNYTLNFDQIDMIANTVMLINKINPLAGHVAERLCSWLFSYVPIYPNRLTHLYADSHGTQGHHNYSYEQLKSQLL